MPAWTRLTLSAALIAAPAPAAAAPDTDTGAMASASADFAEAERLLAAGDPDGAIQRFQEGLDKLPEGRGYAPTRAEVLLTIVDAEEAAFRVDGDLERLRRAKRLLDRYLGPLELLDEQGRADAEARRVVVMNTILTVEQRRKGEAAAREAAARREAAALARRRGRVRTLAGAALVGVGGAGLAVMGTGAGLGAAAKRDIDGLITENNWKDPCADPECRASRRDALDPLVARGNAGNVMFVVGAATGGALLASGIALLLLGRKSKREARALEVTPAPAPAAWGLGLRGRF